VKPHDNKPLCHAPRSGATAPLFRSRLNKLNAICIRHMKCVVVGEEKKQLHVSHFLASSVEHQSSQPCFNTLLVCKVHNCCPTSFARLVIRYELHLRALRRANLPRQQTSWHSFTEIWFRWPAPLHTRVWHDSSTCRPPNRSPLRSAKELRCLPSMRMLARELGLEIS
jgi:hypothetical protein